MALSRTDHALQSALGRGASAAAYVTGSLTLPANSITVIAAYGNAYSDSAVRPTQFTLANSAGLTMTLRETTGNPAQWGYGIRVWSVSNNTASPVSTTFTVQAGASLIESWIVAAKSWTGYDTSTPIVAGGLGTNATGTGAGSLTLGSVPATSDEVFAALIGVVDTGHCTTTAGSGFTEIDYAFEADWGYAQTQVRTGSTSTNVPWAECGAVALGTPLEAMMTAVIVKASSGGTTHAVAATDAGTASDSISGGNGTLATGRVEAGIASEVMSGGASAYSLALTALASAVDSALTNMAPTVPVIIATNRLGGATSGGESNKGSKISVYLRNPGIFSDWGVSKRLLIGGVEVDNYRCLQRCVGDGSGGVGDGVYESFGIWRLTAQVGSLGAAANGSVLNITVTVNGVVSLGNRSTAGQYFDENSGAALTFTVHPVTFVQVDPAGSNANSGAWGSPLLDLQGPTGFTGAFKCASAAGATDGVKPATDIELTDTTGIGFTRPGLSTVWMQAFRISGTAMTGAANRGPIRIFGHAGPAGANTPHRIHYTAPGASGTGAGGYMGPDQARSSGNASETNPYDGLPGWGRFIELSDIDDITCNPLGPRDGCPINLSSSSDDCRFFNIGGQWKSTVSGAQAAKAGFIAGNGYRIRAGCLWGHDIQAGDGLNQNHLVYIDGSARCANDVVISHSCGRDITCGNGLQSYNSQAADTIKGVVFHDIVIKRVNKHLLNCSDNTESRTDYNIIGIDAGEACINMSTGALKTTAGYKYFNCSFSGWARVLARPAVWNQGGTGTGSTDGRNCVFRQRAGGVAGYSFTSLDNTGTNAMQHCCWYDETGVLTAKPTSDSTGFYGDPLYTSIAANDLSLQTGSPCIDTGVATLVTRSSDIFGSTITGNPDLGAAEKVVAAAGQISSNSAIDALTGSDVRSVKATIIGGSTDVLTGSESASGAMQGFRSTAEAVVGTSAQALITAGASTVAETLVGLDAKSGSLIGGLNTSEGGAVVDTMNQFGGAQVFASESVTVSETLGNTFVALTHMVEALTAIEVPIDSAIMIGSLVEILASVTSISNGGIIARAVTESGSVDDSLNAIRLLSILIAEAPTVTDVSQTSGQQPGVTNESGQLAATQFSISDQNAVIANALVALDHTEAGPTRQAILTEILTSAELQNWLTITFSLFRSYRFATETRLFRFSTESRNFQFSVETRSYTFAAETRLFQFTE